MCEEDVEHVFDSAARSIRRKSLERAVDSRYTSCSRDVNSADSKQHRRPCWTVEGRSLRTCSTWDEMTSP